MRALATVALSISIAGCNLVFSYRAASPDARAPPRPDAARDDRAVDLPRDVNAAPDYAKDPDAADAEGGLGDARAVPGTWVSLSKGTFMMGSPQDEPCRRANEDQREVTLSHGFEVQTTEVTQEQFSMLMGYNPSHYGPEGSGASCGLECPVENVSWHEAVIYCNALSVEAGMTPCYACAGSGASAICQEVPAYGGAAIYACPGYRLPTEAEWEYAYRAGTLSAYHSGAADANTCRSCTSTDVKADEVAWYCANSGYVPHTVGQKSANAWGLHDMAGNVWEWCHDRYEDKLGTDPVIDPWGSQSATERVARGGSFISAANTLRAASRYFLPPSSQLQWRGFRCVRTKPLSGP